MFNAGAETVDFRLPALPPGDRWYRAADTGRQVPQDLFPVGEEPLWEDPHAYRLNPRSSAMLLVRRAPGTEGK